MKEIQVALGEKSYWIKIAAGLLAAAGDEIRRVLPQTEKIAVITDSNVAPLYGERLRKSLEMAGFSVTVWEFPAGEESKNLAVLGRLYEGLAAAGLGITGVWWAISLSSMLKGIVAFIWFSILQKKIL